MDIKPIELFFKEEITPKELATLLNEFCNDYLDRIIKLQLLDDEFSLHIDTLNFFYTTKRLIEVLKT